MRKEFIILAAIVVITISAAAVTVANLSDDPGNSQQMKGLTQDLAAPSQMTAFDARGADVPAGDISKEPHYYFLGMPYNETQSRLMDRGYVAVFAPQKPVIVEAVLINGKCHNDSGLLPFALELWNWTDAGNLGNLICRFTDISIAYFPFKAGSQPTVIEIPPIEIKNNFAVVFSSRDDVAVSAHEVTSSMSSSFVVERGTRMWPAVTANGTSLEWDIDIAGRDA